MGSEISLNLSFKFKLNSAFTTINDVNKLNIDIDSESKIIARGNFYTGRIKEIESPFYLHLHTLDLSDNLICLFEANYVRFLFLQSNKLEKFNSNSHTLQILNISDNLLKNLTLSAPNLLILKANGNMLTTILYIQCPKLQVLELSENMIDAINLEEYQELREICINYCGLKQIQLPTNLTSITLNNNKLQSLRYFGKNLTYLDISSNNIKQLQGYFLKLITLSIQQNIYFADFESIVNCNNLQKFNVQHTKFNHLFMFINYQTLVDINIKNTLIQNYHCLRRNQYTIIEADPSVQIVSLPIQNNIILDARCNQDSQQYDLIQL